METELTVTGRTAI